MNKKTTAWFRGLLLTLICSTSAAAFASLGPYEHGNGIKALGLGGVSYVDAEETTALSANPAHASWLGNRYDIGVDVLTFFPEAEIRGNQIAPDSTHDSDGRKHYPLPQGGVRWQLGEDWAVGVSILLAGVGPDYMSSPYARFGGAPRASLQLGSSSIATALSYKVNEANSVGFGVALGYQTLSVKGLEFLAAPSGPSQVSLFPNEVTNKGKDGSATVSVSLGWAGDIGENTKIGASYRTKTWTGKHRDYRGLLPDGGSLELPAVYGLGVSRRLTPTLTALIEWQRFDYEKVTAFGNRLEKLAQGNLLGSSDGPGFGLKNQNAYKIGLRWLATPALTLRAGFLTANQNVRDTDSLFPMLAPISVTTHYTMGWTQQLGQWEWSGFASYAPRKTRGGEGSIPPGFGGGVATTSNENYGLGFSFGRAFGQ